MNTHSTLPLRVVVLIFISSGFFFMQKKPAALTGTGPVHAGAERKNVQSEYSPAEIEAMRKAVALMPTDQGKSRGPDWQCIGPNGIFTPDTFRYAGRIRSLAWANNVGSLDLGLRIGSASGGVWRLKRDLTSPLGYYYPESLSNNGPSSDFNCPVIGSIAVHPTNKNIMLAATGEPSVSTGTGIWRTTDGGNTWSNVLSSPFARAFYKIAFNENNPGDVIALTTGISGITMYTSWDTGTTWTPSFLGNNVWDAVVAPGSTDSFYLAMESGGVGSVGIFTLSNQSFTLMGSFPGSNTNRINIDVSKTSPNILYANVAKDTLGKVKTQGIYKSTDYGATWTKCPHNNGPGGVSDFDFHYDQGDYNNCIRIHPTNPNVVLAGGGRLMRCTDGNTFIEVPQSGHVDNHDILWNPTGTKVYLANDGGLYESNDNGLNWSSPFNSFPIAQFYEFEVSKRDHKVILGATQDNGIVNSWYQNNNYSWEWHYGGDAGYVAIDHNDAQHAIAQVNVGNRTSGNLYETSNGGLSWTWISNINGVQIPRWPRTSNNLNASNENYPYVVQNNMVLRRDASNNWINQNPNNPFTVNIMSMALGCRGTQGTMHNIYVGLISGSQKVWVYDRLFNAWYDYTSGLNTNSNVNYSLYTHFTNVDEVYAVSNGTLITNKIYKSTTAGQNGWQDITGNLPNIPINAFLVNPYNNQQLFIGTKYFGVMKSDDGGATWTRWENGMAKSLDVSGLDFIDSVAINGKLYIAASTYGRSIWIREANGVDPVGIPSYSSGRTNEIMSTWYKANEDLNIQLKVPYTGNYQFHIVGLNGNIIYQQMVYWSEGMQRYQVHLPGLSKGIYMYTIIGQHGERQTTKFGW
ncbi:MAG: hypothetical protein JNJ58_03600 [Chitinophagaceae bacterium]|nr:hypothetical protein [Chitinophagaceae bacterium]